METAAMSSFKDKKVVIFDLDGTLTESKADMTPETAALFARLLEKKKVAVIGGDKYEFFKRQIMDQLKAPGVRFENLFLFPENSTMFYRFQDGDWKQIYEYPLTDEEKKKIKDAFEHTFNDYGYRHPVAIYGDIIEDRGSEITFSAHGQKAPLELRKKWNEERDIRQPLMELLRKRLPEFEVRQGGLTSIDVTRKGIDKAYGIERIEKILGVPIKNMIFVGDALFPGGNDDAAVKTGIDCLKVSGPGDTNKFMESLLKD